MYQGFRRKNKWLLIRSRESLQTDKAAMLDEVVDYVKFLRLQVKVTSSHILFLGCSSTVLAFVKFCRYWCWSELVMHCSACFRAIMHDGDSSFTYELIVTLKQVLSMSRLGGAGAVAPLVTDIPLQSVEVITDLTEVARLCCSNHLIL